MGMSNPLLLASSTGIYPFDPTYGVVIAYEKVNIYVTGTDGTFCMEGEIGETFGQKMMDVPPNIVDIVDPSMGSNPFWILHGSIITLYSSNGLTKIQEINVGEDFVRGYASYYGSDGETEYFCTFSKNYVYTFKVIVDDSGIATGFSLENTYNCTQPIKKALFYGFLTTDSTYSNQIILIFEDGSARAFNYLDHTIKMIYPGTESKVIEGLFYGNGPASSIILLTEKTLEFIQPSFSKSVNLPNKNPVTLGGYPMYGRVS
jgi:hypothetical protein